MTSDAGGIASGTSRRRAAIAAGRWLVLGLVGALVLVGCGPSHYARLIDENGVPSLAALKNRYSQEGNHTTFVSTGGGIDPSIRVALHEVGPRDGKTLMVLVHGAFADHRMWRFLGGALAHERNMLLIDLPGCGESECPDPEGLPADAYSPPDLARRTLQALRAHLASREDSPRLVLVAHSLGGAVVFRMYIEDALRHEFADVLERVDSVTALSPLDVAVEKSHPVIIELTRVSGMRVWGALQTGLLRERVAKGVLEASSLRDRALRQEADWKIATLTNFARRRAMQAMLLRAVPSVGMRPDWSQIDPIVAAYPRVTPPVLIIWGEHDEVLPVSMGYKLAAQLPEARLVVVPGAMHSLVLEQPELVARLISEFLAGARGGRRVERAREVRP